MSRLLTITLISLFVVGCATSTRVLTGTARTPIEPTQVKIYSHPPADFEEIAILTASSGSAWAFTDQGKMDAVMEELKEQAALLGANGLLLLGLGESRGGGVAVSSYGSGTGMTYYGGAKYKTGQAVAIYLAE